MGIFGGLSTGGVFLGWVENRRDLQQNLKLGVK